MTTVYAGHYADPVKAASGRAIPNATFQLYLPGTKTSPTYYKDRTKGVVVTGDPTSDDRGNVDIWPEPGIYEYWYNGIFIQLVTVEQDDDEDDAALAALQETITSMFANYYTKTETDDAISSGGGPTVGAELLAHKGVINGYAGLNGSAIVPDNQLPATATTGTRTPSTHGASHDSGGSDPIDNLNGYLGLTYLHVNASQNAVEGKFHVCDMSIGNVTVTLPTPSGANAKPIAVKRLGAANTLNITGLIDTTPSLVLPIPIDGMVIWLVPDVSNAGWYLFSNYIPLTSLARLDADNDFGGHVVKNARDNQVSWTGTTLLVGTDVPWGSDVQLTNASGCTVTLPNNAAPGDFVIIGQGSSSQDTFVAQSGGFLVEPDSFFKTAKQNAAVYIKCITGTGANAGFRAAGYTSA